MTPGLTVETRVLGQKRTAPAWTVPVPDTGGGTHPRLRDLIAHVVVAEVSAFHQRQEDHRLIQVLSPHDIARGVETGKVDSGGHDIAQRVDPQESVDVALGAFEDGFYFVFLDGVQQRSLDDEIFLRPESRLAFVRLTPLAGG